jgi:multidrug resistance efflux pump
MLKLGLIFAVFLSMTSLAQARDVSAQQVGMEYARVNLEKAEAEHKDNLQRVSDSEKRLAEDRQKAAISKKNLDESKAKYDKAQQLLDQAWKQP